MHHPFNLIVKLMLCSLSFIIQLFLLMIQFFILVIKSFDRPLQLIRINHLERSITRNPFMIIHFAIHLFFSIIIDSHFTVSNFH